MGYNFVDQYSILHYAIGIISYFLYIPFIYFIIIYILFEFIENTDICMTFINTYFIHWWPGGKTHPDNLLDRVSDTLFAAIGWIIAYLSDMYYKNKSLTNFQILLNY
jgi:hypothetical protein